VSIKKFPITIKLYSEIGYYWRGYEDIWLCRSGLQRIFDVPKTALTIWLVAHKRPAKDRVKIEPYNYNHILLDGRRTFVDDDVANMLGTETVYVECWWE
jgi:hypothetical protein